MMNIFKMIKQHRSTLTMNIILVNTVMFILTVIWPEFILNNGMISTDTMVQPHRWLTSMFLHGGFLHFIFNMITFMSFGISVEKKLGKVKFLSVYILGGIAGTVAQLMLGTASVPMLGASGCICAIIGVLAVSNPNSKLFLFFIIPIKLQKFVFGFAIISVACHYLGWLSGLGHMAHSGSIIFGWVIAKFVYKISPTIKKKRKIKSRRRRRIVK